MCIYLGGVVRIATTADIEHVFAQLTPSAPTTKSSFSVSSPPQKSSSFSPASIAASDLELAAELLGYSLSIEEIKDCVLYCTGTTPIVETTSKGANNTGTTAIVSQSVVLKYTDKISLPKFAAWWNSDRCNPNLKHWKATHTATAGRIEGPGTVFG